MSLKPIHKYIKLDNLPKYRGGIDWTKSIGCDIYFEYKHICGVFKIVGYDKPSKKITVQYLDELFKIDITNIRNVPLGKLLKEFTDEFKIDIGSKFNDNNRDMNIIGREYRRSRYKYYKYHCNKCGNEDWILEGNLLKGKGCNVCCINSRKILNGYNDIATTDPWMCNIGISEEDSKKYTSQSNQKVIVTCPNCKKEKEMKISDVYRNKSIACSCGDGVSYSEKIIISLLDQLGIKYIKEYKPKWSNNKRYDFYLSYYNAIIECHGEQHYRYTGFDRTLKEEQKNDKYKKELALENGVDEYIILDCRKSNLEFIKTSILNSELSNMFNLSNIDWLECERFTLSNKVKEVCDYWHLHNEINNEKLTTSDLSIIFNIDRHTVLKYLKKGTKLEWCNYNVEKEKIKIKNKRIEHTKNSRVKPIKILKNDQLLGIFISISELVKHSEKFFNVKMTNCGISCVLNGNQKTHRGYNFEYIQN